MARLKITSNGIAAEVLLDGVDISKSLSGATIDLNADGKNTATLRVPLRDVEIDAEVKAVLDRLETRTDDSGIREATTLADRERTYVKDPADFQSTMERLACAEALRDGWPGDPGDTLTLRVEREDAEQQERMQQEKAAILRAEDGDR